MCKKKGNIVKKGILVASFGTSHEASRRSTICEVEELVRAAFPGSMVESAYTSRIVRGILKKRGINAVSPEEALEKMAENGVDELIVQPTHLIPGEEYEKLLQAVREYKGRFAVVRAGQPLFSATRDLLEAVSLLNSRFPEEEGTCVLLMGHGSAHPANMVYSALSYMMHKSGRKDILIATVEGYPSFDEVLPELLEKGFRKVMLAPLMLVAGDHAVNDMAGSGPDSWKSILENEGLGVAVQLKGLGEDPDFRAMYIRHIEQAEMFV